MGSVLVLIFHQLFKVLAPAVSSGPRYPFPRSPSAAYDNASKWADTRFRKPMFAAGSLEALIIS
jgi:hypothetical protein